jgi:O-acetylserine/cysteine efflux transporter
MPIRHAALALAVAFFWGLNFVAIDVGLDTFPPLLFVALRFALTAFPAILIFRSPGVPWRWVLVIGAFLTVGQFGLLFVGIHEGVPAGLSSIVFQLQVVFTILFAVLALGERPTRVQLLGAAVAIGGLLVIALARSASVPLFGLVLVVGAAASWGAANVTTKMAKPRDPISLLVWASVVGPLPLGALSLVIEGPAAIAAAMAAVGWPAILSLAYIVLLATFFGWGAWTWLLSRHQASVVAPFALLAPVSALISTWLWRGEQPTAGELIGGALIMSGLALAVLTLRRPVSNTTALATNAEP